MDLRLDLRATSADLFFLSFLSPPPHGLGNLAKEKLFPVAHLVHCD
jgi:hypothetical protein